MSLQPSFLKAYLQELLSVIASAQLLKRHCACIHAHDCPSSSIASGVSIFPFGTNASGTSVVATIVSRAWLHVLSTASGIVRIASGIAIHTGTGTSRELGAVIASGASNYHLWLSVLCSTHCRTHCHHLQLVLHFPVCVDPLFVLCVWPGPACAIAYSSENPMRVTHQCASRRSSPHPLAVGIMRITKI